MGRLLFIVTFVALSDVFILIEGLPTLLLATRNNIQLVEVNALDINKKSSIVIDNFTGITAMDFIYTDSSVYWTDINLKTIKHAWLNGSGDITNVIATDLESPDGLATDWLGKKLYWADSDKKRIEVCELDGRNRRVLYWDNMDSPRAIALDPQHGYMYWTDVGEDPKIERAGMDGLRRSVLISTNIYWPNGLTIDYVNSKIYWIDAKLEYIRSCNLDGSDEVIFPHQLAHPFALTLFDGTLFWTDWKTRSIKSLTLWSDLADVEVIFKSINDPMDVHVYSEDRQLKGLNETPCNHDNGGCSHLCLLSPVTPYFKCECPTGVKLLDDNTTCADGAEEFLLVARKTELLILSLDTPDYTHTVLPVPNLKHVFAIDYDLVEGHVYWTESGSPGSISRSNLNGTGQEVVIRTNIKEPEGMAVDWIARNLYWTDTGYDTIQVSRLNGSFRTILISTGLDEPRVIRVDPLSGLMFWTDWGIYPKIERANMDGSNRVVLVDSSLAWPNGLSIDHGEQNVYWADAKTKKLEAVTFDGRHRRVLKQFFREHVFGLSLSGNYLYWSDWAMRTVSRMDKRNNKTDVIVEQLPNLYGIKAVSVRKTTATNPCAVDNFGCSHLCLVRQRRPPKCVCPNGLEIDNDGKICPSLHDARLFLTTGHGFQQMRLGADTMRLKQMPMRERTYVLAFDIHINENRIYWIDAVNKNILRSFINNTVVEQIIQHGLDYPEDIALDWLSGNVYWVDLGTSRIEVARGNGSSRKVLLWKNIGYVTTLTVDPNTGYMFWTEWATPTSIVRSALDGTGRTTLLQNLGRANGLTIDYSERRLYWANIDRCIESADVEGNNRTCVIEEDIRRPTRITVYRDSLIWVDWQKQTVEIADKHTGSNRTVLQSRVGTVMDVFAHYFQRQTGQNACQNNNGGCSHLCIPMLGDYPSITTHTCACPTHHTLNSDNITCEAPTSSLLFSQKNQINQLVLPSNATRDEILDSLDVVLPIDGLSDIEAISYDPVDNNIYTIDKKTIKKFNINEKQVTTVLENGNMQYKPYDLDIEPFSRLLFWTCSKTNVISINRLNLTSVGVVVRGDDERPRSIAIDPINGLIYWVNRVVPPTIEEAALDGSRRITLISGNLVRPGPITLDIVEETLYWTDSRLQRIECYDLSYGTRRLLVDGDIGNPKGITVLGDFLYWVDKKYMALERVNKVTGKDRTYVKFLINRLSDICGAQTLTSLATADHPCRNNNGGCSHICLPGQDGTARCSCPLTHRLRYSFDKKCLPRHSCGSHQFECYSGGIYCIPNVWRCDGLQECEDGSDEADC